MRGVVGIPAIVTVMEEEPTSRRDAALLAELLFRLAATIGLTQREEALEQVMTSQRALESRR
jgi:hypothetical protein